MHVFIQPIKDSFISSFNNGETDEFFLNFGRDEILEVAYSNYISSSYVTQIVGLNNSHVNSGFQNFNGIFTGSIISAQCSISGTIIGVGNILPVTSSC